MGIDLIIRGGTLVSETSKFRASIAIDDGIITSVGHHDNLPTADKVTDASDKLVFPGVVDPHVHLGADPWSNETFKQASTAAALGGVTTFIPFAFQEWEGDEFGYESESTLLEGIDNQKTDGEESLIDYSVHGAIVREDPKVFDQLPKAIDAGVTSFKFYTVYPPVGVSNGFLQEVFEQISDLDAVALVHTEDPTVIES